MAYRGHEQWSMHTHSGYGGQQALEDPFADPGARMVPPVPFASPPASSPAAVRPARVLRRVDKSTIGRPKFVDSSNGITPSGFVSPPPPSPPTPAVLRGAVGDYPKRMSRFEALRATPGAPKKHGQAAPLSASVLFWVAVGLFFLSFASSAAAIGVAAYMATQGITIPSWLVLWVVISVILGVVVGLLVLVLGLWKKKGEKKVLGEMGAGLLVGQMPGDIELGEGVGGGLGRRAYEREEV